MSRVSDLKPVIELADGRTARHRAAARVRGGLHAGAGPGPCGFEGGPGNAVLVLSFGGDPRVIRELPAYQELEAEAAAARIDLHFSVMSATMGARLGPGALSVAWQRRS
jgi:fatty acid-binding protein DegV